MPRKNTCCDGHGLRDSHRHSARKCLWKEDMILPCYPTGSHKFSGFPRAALGLLEAAGPCV